MSSTRSNSPVQNHGYLVQNQVATVKQLINYCIHTGVEVFDDGVIKQQPLWNPEDVYATVCRQANIDRIQALLQGLKQNGLLTPASALAILLDYPPVVYKLLTFGVADDVNLLRIAAQDEASFENAFEQLKSKWALYDYRPLTLKMLLFAAVYPAEESREWLDKQVTPKEVFQFFKSCPNNFELEILATVLTRESFLQLYHKAKTWQPETKVRSNNSSNQMQALCLLYPSAVAYLVFLVTYEDRDALWPLLSSLFPADADAFLTTLFTPWPVKFLSRDHCHTISGAPYQGKGGRFNWQSRYDWQAVQGAYRLDKNQPNMSLAVFARYTFGSTNNDVDAWFYRTLVSIKLDQPTVEKGHFIRRLFFSRNMVARLLDQVEGEARQQRMEALRPYVIAWCVDQLSVARQEAEEHGLDVAQQVNNIIPKVTTVFAEWCQQWPAESADAAHHAAVEALLPLLGVDDQFLFLERLLHAHVQKFSLTFWLTGVSCLRALATQPAQHSAIHDLIVRKFSELDFALWPAVMVHLSACFFQAILGSRDSRSVPQRLKPWKGKQNQLAGEPTSIALLEAYTTYGVAYEDAWSDADPVASVQSVLKLANRSARRDMYFVRQLRAAISRALLTVVTEQKESGDSLVQQQVRLVLREVLQALCYVFYYNGTCSSVPKVGGRKAAAFSLIAVKLSALLGYPIPAVCLVANDDVKKCRFELRANSQVLVSSKGAQFSGGVKKLWQAVVDPSLWKSDAFYQSCEKFWDGLEGARDESDEATINITDKVLFVLSQVAVSEDLDQDFINALADEIPESPVGVGSELLQAVQVFKERKQKGAPLSPCVSDTLVFLVDKVGKDAGMRSPRFKSEDNAVLLVDEGDSGLTFSSEGAQFRAQWELALATPKAGKSSAASAYVIPSDGSLMIFGVNKAADSAALNNSVGKVGSTTESVTIQLGPMGGPGDGG